eukprot:1934138-Pleurochrysis_carterae.AAC.2
MSRPFHGVSSRLRSSVPRSLLRPSNLPSSPSLFPLSLSRPSPPPLVPLLPPLFHPLPLSLPCLPSRHAITPSYPPSRPPTRPSAHPAPPFLASVSRRNPNGSARWAARTTRSTIGWSGSRPISRSALQSSKSEAAFPPKEAPAALPPQQAPVALSPQ